MGNLKPSNGFTSEGDRITNNSLILSLINSWKLYRTNADFEPQSCRPNHLTILNKSLLKRLITPIQKSLQSSIRIENFPCDSKIFHLKKKRRVAIKFMDRFWKLQRPMYINVTVWKLSVLVVSKLKQTSAIRDDPFPKPVNINYPHTGDKRIVINVNWDGQAMVICRGNFRIDNQAKC